jgi:hypothetical protein
MREIYAQVAYHYLQGVIISRDFICLFYGVQFIHASRLPYTPKPLNKNAVNADSRLQVDWPALYERGPHLFVRDNG